MVAASVLANPGCGGNETCADRKEGPLCAPSPVDTVVPPTHTEGVCVTPSSSRYWRLLFLDGSKATTGYVDLRQREETNNGTTVYSTPKISNIDDVASPNQAQVLSTGEPIGFYEVLTASDTAAALTAAVFYPPGTFAGVGFAMGVSYVTKEGRCSYNVLQGAALLEEGWQPNLDVMALPVLPDGKYVPD